MKTWDFHTPLERSLLLRWGSRELSSLVTGGNQLSTSKSRGSRENSFCEPLLTH